MRRCRLMIRPLENRTLPATFTVLNLSDNGPDSLRDCVAKANLATGADTINFDAAVIGTIILTTGELGITDAVSILGPGPSKLMVSGNNVSRVFNLGLVSAPPVAVSGLTLTSGKATGGFGGGAILGANRALALTDCVLTGNDATSSGGGAVCGGTSGGTTGLTLAATNCTFSGNTGEAIWNLGPAAKTVLNVCTLSGNKGNNGNALYVREGDLTVTACTISGNSPLFGTGFGGALRVAQQGASATVTIRNSTISGNSVGASLGTGVVYLTNFAGALLVQNSTISANTGFGIRQVGGAGAIHLDSTIVAQNGLLDLDNSKAVSITANDCLIGIADNFGLNLVGSNNLTGTTAKPLDAKLGPLANNGGPTLTQAPLAGSPAIDAGNNPALEPFDQRGAPFQRNLGRTDIGAVELLRLQVTNLNDSGDGSLRQAVIHANSHIGADTITFDPALFTLFAQTIKLTTGELSLQQDTVTIAGPGYGFLTISGNFTSRIFDSSEAPPSAVITISGLSLHDGVATIAAAASAGGVIRNQSATLHLFDCTFYNNQAIDTAQKGAFGGAVSSGGPVTAVNCTFASNSASSSNGSFAIGGALDANNGCQLTGCTFSDNHAGKGGGLISSSGSLFVDGCTFSANVAAEDGGGIVVGNPGSMIIRNSTISGNKAGNNGGGIFCPSTYYSQLLNIENCTVTGNLAVRGGGVYCESKSTTLRLSSSIVAQNNAVSPALGPDIGSGVVGPPPLSVLADRSLVGVADSGSFSLQGAGNLTGTLAVPLDAMLGPFAGNGGPTLTHALLPGSPAIDTGMNMANLPTDQRGFARVVGPAADIGAYELQAVSKITGLQVNDGGPQRSRVASLKVTFDQAPVAAGSLAGAFQLKRQSDNAAVTLAATAVGNVVMLTFTGGAVNAGSLADGRFTLTAFATQIPNLDGNGDGTAGDDFVLVGDLTNKLFRLFGDNDGDGDVDSQDFGAFRAAFGGTTNLAFDFDNDDDVDAADFGQFRARFGASV